MYLHMTWYIATALQLAGMIRISAWHDPWMFLQPAFWLVGMLHAAMVGSYQGELGNKIGQSAKWCYRFAMSNSPWLDSAF